MEINENSLFSLDFHEKVMPSRRLARPQEAVSAAFDVPSHVPANPSIAWDPQNDRGVSNRSIRLNFQEFVDFSKKTYTLYLLKKDKTICSPKRHFTLDVFLIEFGRIKL